MRLRRRRRKPEESIEALLPRFDEQGAWDHADTPPATPVELVERAELRAVVRDCIDQLPPSYRTILLLRDVEDLDTDEVAAALGMTVSAVKTRLHRARQALRTLLLRCRAIDALQDSTGSRRAVACTSPSRDAASGI